MESQGHSRVSNGQRIPGGHYGWIRKDGKGFKACMVYLPVEVWQAFDIFCRRNGRTKTAMLAEAIGTILSHNIRQTRQ